MTTTQSPPLVLLPGLLNDARLWRHQIAGLSDVARVSVGDLTQHETITAMAEAVLAKAPAGQFALAGLSLGGYVALEIMRQAPERVIALALLDTSARPDTPEAIANRHKLMDLAESNFQGVIDSLLPKMLHPQHLADEHIVQIFTDMAFGLGKEVFARQQHAIINRIDSLPFLPQIHCPTLVLCGREDGLTPLGVHHEMVSAIPHAGLVIVENSGHLSVLEQPLRVTEALGHWLAAINATPE